MAEATSEALSQNRSILGPGESGNFIYVGEMIPNQVEVANRGDSNAEYTLESGKEGWKFFATAPAGRISTLIVEWFNGVGTFHNLSTESSIEIYGDGIFPEGQEPSK